MDESFIVPKAGLEPAYLAAHAPETCVSTNFTTSALCPGLDSNQHTLRHTPLKRTCLPISPPGQVVQARAAKVKTF